MVFSRIKAPYHPHLKIHHLSIIPLNDLLFIEQITIDVTANIDCVFFPESEHKQGSSLPRNEISVRTLERVDDKQRVALSGERFVTSEARNRGAWKRIQTWWERRLRLIRFRNYPLERGKSLGVRLCWLAMGRKHKRRLIPEQDRRICGSICFCQFTIVISCVALVYLSVAIYMPSHR